VRDRTATCRRRLSTFMDVEMSIHDAKNEVTKRVRSIRAHSMRDFVIHWCGGTPRCADNSARAITEVRDEGELTDARVVLQPGAEPSSTPASHWWWWYPQNHERGSTRGSRRHGGPSKIALAAVMTRGLSK